MADREGDQDESPSESGLDRDERTSEESGARRPAFRLAEVDGNRTPLGALAPPPILKVNHPAGVLFLETA
jgi:hypothetical protein